MRRIILILTLFISIQSFAQTPTGYQKRIVNERIQGSFMVDSAFNIPRYYDTTAANLHKRSDTCGAMFFSYSDNAIWFRACNPKHWELVGSGGNANAYNVTYDARDWGMIPDGVTDNTAAFQAILDDIGTNGHGATIQLDTGVYIISGALQDITNSNSQLVLPTVLLDSQTLSITIRGRQVPPNQFFTTSQLPRSGFSTIKSTLTGGTGTASVISGHHEVGFIGAQNNVALNLYDVIFEVPENPTLSAINLQYHQASSFDNVLINAGSVKLDDITQPTNSNAYGIIFPEYNHTPCNNVGRVDVWGFYYGWRISERTDIKNLSSWGCWYVGELAFGYHASTAQVLASYWCSNGIKVTGSSSIRVFDYQMENVSFGWQSRVIDIDDPSNYLKGDIVYQLIFGGDVRNYLFTKNGDADLNGSNSSSSLSIDSVGRVKYWNGDDSSRRLQINVNDFPAVGNYWLDTDANRIKYSVENGDTTIVYTVAVQDSSTYTPATTVLIEDAFTDANSTGLPAHTIAPTNTPAATWVDVNTAGSITVQTNKASNVTSGVTNYYVDANTADCIIEVTVHRTGGDVDAGVMFRYVTDGNYYTVVISGVSQVFRMQKKLAGSYTTVASTSFTNTTGVDYVIRVVLEGDDISATVDGGNEITYNSSDFNTADKHGLWMASGGGVTHTWDNFKVSTASGLASVSGVAPIVDTIYRTAGIDSIYYKINGVQGAIKDSVGAGFTNLTSFVSQNNWKVFYSDGSGDVKELSIGAAHTYLQSAGASSVPAWVRPTMSKGVTLEAPTSAENFGLWQTQVDITVTSINAVVIGSSPSVTINIAFGSDITSLTNVFSSGTAITNTTTGQTISSGFNDATIPAGSWIRLKSTASSGTITQIEVTINYTED